MFTFTSRIRYTELNHSSKALDPSSIIDYFQDCSTFQSEDLNLGINYLQEKHRIWLLMGWHLIIMKPARLGDRVIIGTWPYGFKGFYGFRNFIMKDDSDKVIAAADSTWVYMDTMTNTPIRVEDNAGYILEPPYDMEHKGRKIKLPGKLEHQASFPVIRSNIDSYNHVNNGQYIRMAEEFLPMDFIVAEMRVEYRKQAVLGDIIIPGTTLTDSTFTVVLSDYEYEPYAIVEFKKQQTDRSA